ncbi:MAG: DUF484 family protein [Lautropia sp.]
MSPAAPVTASDVDLVPTTLPLAFDADAAGIAHPDQAQRTGQVGERSVAAGNHARIDGDAGGDAGAETAGPDARAIDDQVVADWLAANPAFFDQHADLLAEVRIRHPHGGQAISLVERQVAVLRQKNKALEAKMADLIRIGQENDAIGARLQFLTRELLRASDRASLPEVLLAGLRDGFSVPQIAIRLWNVVALPAPWSEPVDADTRRRIDDLALPYCGPNSNFAVARWLDGAGADTASIAQLPLRVGARRETFGVLVLGSADAGRFQAGMGTAFLERIAEIASASLSRLIEPAA